MCKKVFFPQVCGTTGNTNFHKTILLFSAEVERGALKVDKYFRS